MSTGVARSTRLGRGIYRTRAMLQHAIRCLLPGTGPASAPCRPAIDRLEPRQLLAGNLVISEFMASNTATLADKDGDFSDWIEIHNTGSSPASLNGYHLTDNPANLDKWTFPDVTLAADGYLVVFASNKDFAVAGQELHTDFNLDAGGEYLALVEPNGLTVLSEFNTYPKQQADISYGADPAGAGTTLRYFATPSFSRANARAEVVINEIHYNPDVKTELVEFIELYNPGSAAVDLSGAQFTNGVDYTFPSNTSLAGGGYLVVTESPAAFQLKFGKTALGPFVGTLANEGETITLGNRSGGQLDEVDYKLGFPWPIVGDPPGYSIELINPDLDNSLGGNWRTHAPIIPGAGTTLFSNGQAWDFRKGTSEASTPKDAWRQRTFVPNFVQSTSNPEPWYTGNGPIGYDGNNAYGGSPQLGDMQSLYSSFFMRKTFPIADPTQISALQMEAMYDDGFVVWVNGEWAYTQSVTSTTPDDTYNKDPNVRDLANGTARESNGFDVFNLRSAVLSRLVAGNNVIAVQVFNINVGGSSDAFFDARLKAFTGGSGGNSPTPGGRNSVYATNAAPTMRQVNHTPSQPLANQPVTITAHITDPEGVASASLSYQLVSPGNYFSKEDAAYSNPANWTSIAMNDAGANGDLLAGDGIHTAVIPPSVQIHRGLVRYRVTSTDTLGLSITGPYPDDPQPNFAYYVYNGIPTWSGAIQPGSTDPVKKQVVTYDFGAMPQIPVYQLITTRTDHVDAQYIPNSTAGSYGGDGYLWNGTLVYDGVVYDHISYRARGGVWRYAMGKNMWKFDFLRGHEFQPRDEFGHKLNTTWKKLNLGANIQQGDYLNRGEQGLYEHIGFKLFNLAGVPASRTMPIQFRIIENASETNGTASQYDDDFQGLYLAIEQLDGRFLDEHDLPDGNLYKMESGTGGGESNNQGPTQPSNNSDLVAFTNYGATEQWWRDNVDLETYYSLRAIIEGIHQGDIGYGKNYFYYHNPVTNKWTQLPWDLDLTWAENMFGNGNEPFKTRVLYTNSAYSARREPFNTEYRNRLREIIDLLYNPEQVGQMIDEYVAMVDVPAASMVDADRAMWDYNPIMTSSYVNSSKSGTGRFYQASTGKTFRSMADRMKQYVRDVAYGSTQAKALTVDTTVRTLAQEQLAGEPMEATVYLQPSTVNMTEFYIDYLPPGSSTWVTLLKNTDFTAAAGPLLEVSTLGPHVAKAGTWAFARFMLPAASSIRFRGKASASGSVDLRSSVFRERNWMGDPGNGPTLTAQAFDPLIPRRPVVTYVGTPGYAINNLTFRSSAFSDTTGSFAAMKWRIAESTPLTAPAYDPNNPRKYEIAANWESAELATFAPNILIPPDSLQVGKTYRVRVRMKDSTGRWSNWSNPLQFVAGAASNASVKDALRITEVHYNPDPPPPETGLSNEDFEFVELKNTGSQTINLLNVEFKEGIDFKFAEQLLAPGQSVLIVKNLDAFKTRYYTTGMNIAGQFLNNSRLNNAGERITLVDASGAIIQSFIYDGTWYPSADGLGDSIVAIDPRASDAVLNTKDGWRISRISGGTPGADESTLSDNSIVVNEALTHTDGQLGDWIELFNTTNDPVNLAGWWLSDDPGQPCKYQIQPGTQIGPLDFAVFTQSAQFDNPAAPGVIQAFGLRDLGGDEIVLSSATTDGVLTGFRFKQRLDPAKKESTLGRTIVTSTNDPDFTQLLTPTMGYANTPPQVGPIVINEIMYKPVASADAGNWQLATGNSSGNSQLATDNYQYIELRNITDQTVKLYDPLNPANTWRFEQGITYTFDQNVTIEPNEYVLVVPTDDPAAFRARYNIAPTIRIFGPYVGILQLDDETVSLAAPNDPELDNSVTYYFVDRVHYGSTAPWPVITDGASIGRLISSSYGNDPANWSAIPNGTPGLVNFDTTPPTVSITPGSPNPNVPQNDAFTIAFSEPVLGFDLADLALRRNLQGNLLTAAQTLAMIDPKTYVLGNLAPLTWIEGGYDLIISLAGIHDAAANQAILAGSQGLAVNATTIPATSTDTFHLRIDNGAFEIHRNANPGVDPATWTIPWLDMSRLNLTLGSYVINSDLDGLEVNVTNPDPANPTTVLFNTTQRLDGLSLNGYVHASFAAGGDKVLRTNALLISGPAILDLADNGMIVSTGDQAAIGALIRSKTIKAKAAAFTSLAAILNKKPDGSPLKSTFAGQAVSNTDVLVRYGWDGDANLDDVVNADDYFQIDSGFIAQAKGYSNGDFNYDQVVNADDYFLIDSAFIGQKAPLATTTPAPTPDTLLPSPSTNLSARRTRAYADLFSTEPILQ